MSSIDKEQVKHIANLSRLTLNEEELTRYTEQLAEILDYASHLPELDAARQPTAWLRVEEDVAQPFGDSSVLLKNAVAREDGYVKVPAILDKEQSG